MAKDTLCSMIWNHQFIDGSGRVKPCCRFKGDLGTLEGNISETFYSDKMEDIRKKMLNNEFVPGCLRCWNEEENGKKSLRQRYNQHNKLGWETIATDTPKIEWLEIAISNDCNLACRMCDSRYSHKLYDEEVEYNNRPYSKTRKTKMPIESVFPHVPNLKHLKITGGEPLITPDHWRLLDYIIETGHANHIYLNYSTNCTVYPKQHIVDRWQEFEYIELALSLDSVVAQENEYLRYGTKQEEVFKNIERFVELQNELNLHVIARPTVTILNVYHLPETLEYLNSMNIRHNATHLDHPSHLSVTVLPDTFKEMISKKFEDYNYKSDITRKSCEYIKNYMNSSDNSLMLHEFFKHTNFLDRKRFQSFKETYPYFDSLWENIPYHKS